MRATAAGLVLVVCAGAAFGQLRVATWNISNYTGANRAAPIQTAVYATFNGRQMAPDVIAVQEFVSAAALSTFVGVLNTAPGSPGDWAAAPFIDDPDYGDTESALVYRTSKVQFVNALVIANANGTVSDQPRSTYRYDLRPVGYGAAASNHIALYNVHLKAGSTTDDQDRRLIECQRIRANAQGVDTNPSNGPDGLPAGYHFMVLGDFNIQSSSQGAYVELVGGTSGSAGRFFDPINTPGSWNNSGTYRFVHTQDPLGSGGMDDRHDQILVSGSLIDGAGMDYIGNAAIAYSTSTWNDPNHSYRVWGNDGTSFNAQLTTTGNTMVGATIAQAIRDCTDGSGHVPVFLDLRVPAKVTTDVLVIDFGTVEQNSTAPTRSLTVSNNANVALWNESGIANLSYSMTPSAGFAAPGGTFFDSAAPGGNTHTLSMSTATPGTRGGTLTIASNDPDQPTRIVTLSGVVLAPNVPPVADAGPDFTVTDSDASGSEAVLLDGSLSHDPDGTIVNYWWREGAATLATGASPTASVALGVGVHTISLTVTDNRGANHTDTLVVTVEAGRSGCDADYDQNGVADQDDVAYLINVIGGGDNPTGRDPDFDCNGIADQDDVSALITVIAGGDCAC